MGAAEEAKAAKPKSFVIRVFGIFASLFGVPYLIQARDMLSLADPPSTLLMLLLHVAVLTLDFVMGMAAIIIATGLVLHREWARILWLAFVLLLLFVHFNMSVILYLSGYSRMLGLSRWLVFVILFSIISWACLSRPSIKARFQ